MESFILVLNFFKITRISKIKRNSTFKKTIYGGKIVFMRYYQWSNQSSVISKSSTKPSSTKTSKRSFHVDPKGAVNFIWRSSVDATIDRKISKRFFGGGLILFGSLLGHSIKDMQFVNTKSRSSGSKSLAFPPESR